MDIGSRVAFSVRNQARLGVVVKHIDSHNSNIEFDNRKISVAPNDKLYRVDYWRDRNTEKDLDELRQIDPTLTTLEIFTRNRAVVFGNAALRAMWYWGNVNIFGNKLHEPMFVVGEHKGLYGRYRKERGQKIGTIWASRARNHSIKELFSTVIHEQIHQYNWEVELPEGIFDPQEGSHGSAFRRWIPIVRQHAGIVITVKGDANKDDTKYGPTSEEPKTKPFIFSLLHFNGGWIGFILKDKHELDSFAGTARQLLIFNQSEDRRVYAGTSDLQRVKSSLYVAKRGEFNLRRTKHNVGASIIGLVHNTAKPIEGYLLPSPE